MAIYGGIDLGGTKIQAIVLDSDGHRVLGEARHETPRSGGPDAVAREIAASLREAATEAKMPEERLAGIGVGAPGEVDPEAGTVANAGNLPGWEEAFPLADKLSQALGGVRVNLGNDVGVATRAELELGAGRGARSLLGVFWGTGVGGALMLDGELWRGRGGAGEIGHTVVKLGGARCPCGRRGCLEAYAGRRAMEAKVLRKQSRGAKTDLFEIMREKGHDALSSGIWAHALKHGDELAQKLIERAVRALGAGIASAVNLLDVERVVLGGGLGTRFGDEMAQRVAAAMRPHLFNDDRPPELRVAALGDLGGAIGAAMLCGPVS
ncbi:MAG TPA: ROK family protein [Solirubrobacteraceae bacterium]|jgi:glucokinase|nr:ROK family protein [Solirubrobacteraceae bacterium]